MRASSAEAHEINFFHLVISPSLRPRKTHFQESGSVVCMGEGRMVSSHMKKLAEFVKDRRFQKPEMPPTTVRQSPANSACEAWAVTSPTHISALTDEPRKAELELGGPSLVFLFFL